MDTPKSSASRAPVDPKARLAKLEEKYRHELMDYERRAELWDSIGKARKAIAKAKAELA